MERVPVSCLPLYSLNNELSASSLPINTSLLPVEHCGKTFYIRKSTAVWLLSESERVSTDRLLRVRTYEDNEKPLLGSTASTSDLPLVGDDVSVGDFCVFRTAEEGSFLIGHILQFAHAEKANKNGEYKGKTACINNSDLGVLCSWYEQGSAYNIFHFCAILFLIPTIR